MVCVVLEPPLITKEVVVGTWETWGRESTAAPPMAWSQAASANTSLCCFLDAVIYLVKFIKEQLPFCLVALRCIKQPGLKLGISPTSASQNYRCISPDFMDCTPEPYSHR